MTARSPGAGGRRPAAERMRVAVLRAVEEVSGTNEHGNISAIARRAGVSRDFIYDHPELLAEAHRVTASSGTLVADSDGSYQRGLSARNRLLSSEVERLRGEVDEREAEVDQLAKYRALYLGAQLPGPHKIDPEAYAELRATNERLLQDNSALRAKLRRIEETVRARDEDLSAVRATLAEVLAQDKAGGNVSLFRPRFPGSE